MTDCSTINKHVVRLSAFWNTSDILQVKVRIKKARLNNGAVTARTITVLFWGSFFKDHFPVLETCTNHLYLKEKVKILLHRWIKASKEGTGCSKNNANYFYLRFFYCLRNLLWKNGCICLFFFSIDFNISLERTLLHFKINGSDWKKRIFANGRYHNESW